MYGASLNPEPSYLPISSTPSATVGFSVGAPVDGGAWSSVGMTCVSSSCWTGCGFSGTVVMPFPSHSDERGDPLPPLSHTSSRLRVRSTA